MESNAKLAFLGMPGYGQPTPGASQGFWLCSKEGLRVRRCYQAGSLLAQNFNALWCTALTLKSKDGEPIEYFAMQHDDIEPEAYWLDKLIAEMEAKDLDVLGVVSPIKDQKGVTSIALADPEGDNWNPKCRLTMREICDLPETFTSEDVGYPLLLNTGLWVCRFNMDWADQVYFTINDRIVLNRKTGIYKAQVESEDWFFSRLLHELGLKVGCTRKIALNHVGRIKFGNNTAWGTDAFDSDMVTESVIPAKEGFQLPADIDGWLLPEEGRALAKLSAGKRVLEIGSYCGRSTVCIARTAAHVVSVDPHDGRSTPHPRDTRKDLEANLTRYGVRDKVDAHTGTIDSLDGAGPFDLIFIDGAHDLESVQNDVSRAREMLAPGGLLAFHDYREEPGQHDGGWDPGVTSTVNELVAAGGEILSKHATLAVVRPPAETLMEI